MLQVLLQIARLHKRRFPKHFALQFCKEPGRGKGTLAHASQQQYSTHGNNNWVDQTDATDEKVLPKLACGLRRRLLDVQQHGKLFLPSECLETWTINQKLLSNLNLRFMIWLTAEMWRRIVKVSGNMMERARHYPPWRAGVVHPDNQNCVILPDNIHWHFYGWHGSNLCGLWKFSRTLRWFHFLKMISLLLRYLNFLRNKIQWSLVWSRGNLEYFNFSLRAYVYHTYQVS